MTEEIQPVQLLEHFMAAWDIHDAKALSLLFTEDADFTNVFGKSFHGRSAIEAQHAPLFNTMFKSSRLNFTGTSTRFLNENLAAVDAYWEMSGAKDFQGIDWPDRIGLMSLILKKNNGWRIVIMHNMDLPVQK